MNDLKMFKKKNKLLASMSRVNEDSNINTGDFSDKINFGWITKIRVIPVGLIAFATLTGAIATYVNYTQSLDKNRQEVAHIAELRQLSEKVEKSSNLVKTADKFAFSELELSKDKIDKILKVLKNGGKIEEQNTSIDPMDSMFDSKFLEVQKNWTNNRIFIDSLLSNRKDLLELKQTIIAAQNNDAKINNNIISLQSQVKNNLQYDEIAKELYILRMRISQNMSNLFAGETFSLANGYELVKDLRVFNNHLESMINGDSSQGVEKVTDPLVLATLVEIKKNFLPFKNATTPVLEQTENLNAAKDIAKLVSSTAKNISDIAATLNDSFVLQVDTLNNERTLSILLFIISLSSFGLLSLVFYEKSLQAIRFAKVAEKNQANETAVNMLIEQMKPLDEGDFTKHVYVEDKFVLPIAEKIDSTREIFGNMVRKIKTTAYAVQNSANETDLRSQELLKVTIEQYEKLEKSISQLTQITSEMDEVAQTTWIAQGESNQSREASQNGGKLVQESINKMIEIRNNIQESSKKIKKSSESAQAITEVTGLIQSITRQIEVLALNAAIQAASSGESGREFTVVAQEVQRLAYDSKEATNKILALVKEVQEDIGGAVSSMERTTQEVVEGAKLNDSAGKALKRIEELSEQVEQRVADASQKLEEKSAEMTSVSLKMKEVQLVTEKNQEIVRLTVKEVEALNEVSKELEGSIHGFKVE